METQKEKDHEEDPIMDPLSLKSRPPPPMESPPSGGKSLFTLPGGGVSLMPDVRILVISHVFSMNLVGLTLMVVAGAAPYFYLRREHVEVVKHAPWLVIALMGSTTVLFWSILSYVGGLKNQEHWIYVCAVGIMSCAGVTAGLVATHLENLLPFQVIGMAWIQSLAILLYANLSPRYMSLGMSAAYMFCFSTIAWSFSIYAYITDNEWIGAAILGPAALALLAYHVLYIKYTEHAIYDVTWRKMARAVGDFFIFPFLLLFDGNGADKGDKFYDD